MQGFSFLLKTGILTGLFAVVLSGCSQTRPVTVQGEAWVQHKASILKLDTWTINGRVGVYTEDEAWPGDLIWKQKHKQYDLRIVAPLGAGNLHIYSVHGGVVLESSSSPRPYFSPNADALLKQQFGWVLPLDNLRYWIRGIPHPQSPISGQMEFDQQGHLMVLNQSGWKVSFSRYKKAGVYQLPRKVLLEQQDRSVKIIIRQWKL